MFDPAWLAVLLVFGAAVSWYIAVTAAAALLPHRASGLILAGGLPAMAGAVWFAVIGRTGAALALTLGAAMIGSTLVLGVIASADPTEGRRVIQDPQRRLMATLLPVAVVLLVIGFSGEVNLMHGGLLLAAGAIVAWLSTAARRDVPAASMANDSDETVPAASAGPPWARWLHMGLVIILAIAGAGLAVGAAAAAGRKRGEELDTLVAMLICWVLALPLIGVGTRAAAGGQGPLAQRGMTLLSVYLICIGVPVVVFVNAIRHAILSARWESGSRGLLELLPGVPMTLPLWRGDALMLCIAGLLILPAAIGRYRLGKPEGICLIVLYALYIGMTASQRF